MKNQESRTKYKNLHASHPLLTDLRFDLSSYLKPVLLLYGEVVRRLDDGTFRPKPWLTPPESSANSSRKNAGLHFRNDMEKGPAGRQIQIEDPDGNPIELFEPA
jgi:hypothetical protein